jgi:uncharacterized protein (TIGR00730 family)
MAAVKRLCVYCGAAGKVDEAYRRAATDLGRLLAEAGIELVYGGGRIGLMGLIADAALEAGGRVIGVIPGHLHDYEIGHGGVSELVVVDSMHDRKRRMFELADAFAVLPGGLGTLEEAFEIITWKQLGLHDKPIVIVDVQGYWAPLARLVDHVVGEGFAHPSARDLFQVVPGIDELLPRLAQMPQPVVEAASKLV